MTDPQSWVSETYLGLADLLASAGADIWDAPSLCANWQVRHVVAHVTMPVRLTPEQFGAEMAAAGGDFSVLSNRVAERHAALPVSEQLDALRSPILHAWQPPGGGAAGALSHAVIHSLDITVALDRPAVAPGQAIVAVLDQLTASNGTLFGIDLTDLHLEATDTDWAWRNGDTARGDTARGDTARGDTAREEVVRADSGALVALLSGRTLPDGRALPRN